MELGRWDEAIITMIEALERHQFDPILRETAAQLVATHPDPQGLRQRLWTMTLSHRPTPGAHALLSMLDSASK